MSFGYPVLSCVVISNRMTRDVPFWVGPCW